MIWPLFLSSKLQLANQLVSSSFNLLQFSVLGRQETSWPRIVGDWKNTKGVVQWDRDEKTEITVTLSPLKKKWSTEHLDENENKKYLSTQ